MTRKNINIKDFTTQAFDIWENRWFLLTAGDFEKNDFNTMTVAWGSFGTMWTMPFVQAVVRPTRYTYEFMEKYDHFTLSAFPKEFKKDLTLLGTKSGRDGDKIAETKLTPMASEHIASPTFKEADLVIEAQKIYWQDMDSANFLDPLIEKKYPKKDYHRIYFGKVLGVQGV
ncbi:MAG: flavin reductase family protein [bacterium]